MTQSISARDLYIGMKLGKLTLRAKLPMGTKGSYNKRKKWLCDCDCGNRVSIPQFYLVREVHPRRSCGECGKSLKTLHKRVYSIWQMMNRRCQSPTHVAYKYYGGRGISVHEDWHKDNENGFENFFAHVGDPPSPGHTLDRIDVEGNYEPGNVRWATAEEQARNTRAYIRRHGKPGAGKTKDGQSKFKGYQRQKPRFKEPLDKEPS